MAHIGEDDRYWDLIWLLFGATATGVIGLAAPSAEIAWSAMILLPLAIGLYVFGGQQ